MGSKNMTIQRAREILGSEIVNLSDQEVTELIYSTGQFADTLLDIMIDTVTSGTNQLTKDRWKAKNGDSN